MECSSAIAHTDLSLKRTAIAASRTTYQPTSHPMNWSSTTTTALLMCFIRKAFRSALSSTTSLITITWTSRLKSLQTIMMMVLTIKGNFMHSRLEWKFWVEVLCSQQTLTDWICEFPTIKVIRDSEFHSKVPSDVVACIPLAQRWEPTRVLQHEMQHVVWCFRCKPRHWDRHRVSPWAGERSFAVERGTRRPERRLYDCHSYQWCHRVLLRLWIRKRSYQVERKSDSPPMELSSHLPLSMGRVDWAEREET